MSGKVFINERILEIIELYLDDYGKKIHGREISRRLKANQRTTLQHINRLVKINVLNTNIVGKAKQYTINKENPIAKEYLKQAEIFKKMKLLARKFIIHKLLKEIKPENTPMILFGSYAKETERKDSDIDLLLIKDKHEKKIMKKIKEFEKRQNKKIQVQRMTEKYFTDGMEKDHLIIEIIKNHTILSNTDFLVDKMWKDD